MSTLTALLGGQQSETQDQRIIRHCKGICGELLSVPTDVRMPQDAIDNIKRNNENVLKCRSECIAKKRQELRKNLQVAPAGLTPTDVEKIVQETLKEQSPNTQTEATTPTSVAPAQMGVSNKTILILLGAGAVAYFLLKK